MYRAAAKRKKRRTFDWFDLLVYVLTGGFALVCFYPLWYVFIGSVSPYDSFSSAPVALFPTGFNFRYYITVLSTETFRMAFLISVLKTALGTLGMIAVTSCLAYAVSKSGLKGMKFINIYIIFTMYFGGTIIQYYLLYKDLHMLDTLWVMVVPGFVSPWTFIVMRNYFANTIPPDLENAAMIDGANEAVIFARIIVPISKPIFASMILFAAVGHWNDWTSFTYYCQSNQLQPFVKVLQNLLIDPNAVSRIANPSGQTANMQLNLPPPTALKYTVIMCAMLPIMAIYPFLQKYFAQGILIGAVKE